MGAKLFAEFLGTLWLVLGGCGSAVIAAGFPEVGIGLLGVAFAFGLTVLTAAYAVGPISGGHFNPAVTVGLCLANRFPARDVAPYVAAQVVAGVAAAAVLLTIAQGSPTFNLADNGLAQNGFEAASPGGYSLVAALIIETLLTAAFLIIIVGTT